MTQQPELKELSFSFPFKFLGNQEGCKVYKADDRWGDGEIYTKSESVTNVGIIAHVELINSENKRIARVHLNYNVWESLVSIRQNHDSLCFDATFDCELPHNTIEEFYEGDKLCRRHIVYDVLNANTECRIRDAVRGKHHEWMPFDGSYYREINQYVEWMNAEDLKVKIDDVGNELTKVGNIGVQGIVNFRVMRITMINRNPQPLD